MTITKYRQSRGAFGKVPVGSLQQCNKTGQSFYQEITILARQFTLTPTTLRLAASDLFGAYHLAKKDRGKILPP